MYQVKNVSGENPNRKYKKKVGRYYVDGSRHLILSGDKVTVSNISPWRGKKTTSFSDDPKDWNRHTCFVITDLAEQEKKAKLEAEKEEQERLAKLEAEKKENERLVELEAEKKEQERLAKMKEEEEEWHKQKNINTDAPESKKPDDDIKPDKTYTVDPDFEDVAIDDDEPAITVEWLIEPGNLSRILEIKREFNIKMPGYNSMSIEEKANFIVNALK